MSLATILIIAYMPEVDPTYVTVHATPSHEACEVKMEQMNTIWRDLYPDMELYCHRSAILWSSPVPKERKK